jgi:Swt1-like HEPN
MARTNSAVLNELREKLGGVSRQAVEQRRDRITAKVAMPADIAAYVLAQRQGVRIARHLDEATLEKVAEYESRLTQKEAAEGSLQPVPAATGRRAKGSASRAPKPVVLDKIKVPDGALTTQQANDAGRMAGTVYPLLYVFENSARAFVMGHLSKAYGKDWWDRPKLVPTGVRKVVARNQASSGKDRWVERATVHPIYLTELGHLADIITSEDGWKVFSPMFPRQSWVTEHFRTIEAPRNVVAHMNALTANNVQGLQTRCREWFDQIADHLPGA